MTKRTAVWLPAILAAGTALAAPTKSVRVTTYQELAEGQVSGVLLSSQGEARSGFAASRLALPTPGDDSVRAMVTAPDGTTYLGTGGESPSVLVYRQGKLQRLAKLDSATWVTALVLVDEGKGGQLLVGTAQDGRIFRVGPDGRSEVVAQVEGEHIWALVRDGKRGVTYVATGPGALWAIADADLQPGTKKPSRARKLFASDARQFLSLDRADNGALYVGTADDAVLYRVDPDRPGDAVRAVHDFAGNEIRAIAHYKDAVFVAVNDMQRGDTSSRGTKIVPPAAGTAPGVKAASATGSSAPANPSPVEKKGKGALYRIDASGRVEQLHAVVDGFFNALVVDGEGNLFAAASTPGGRGRLYWVAPPTGSASQATVYTALEVKESDVLTVAGAGSGAGPGAVKERLIGTGNSGAMYALRDQAPTDATYTSKAFSVGAPSRWGSLRFQGQLGAGGGLRLETRSGNLTKPDGSWSTWQPLANLAQQPATDEQSGRIASPLGRYLQVRALFSGQAVLRDFTFYYQPLNQRSRVTEVLIGEDASGRVARGARPSSSSIGAGASPVRLRSPVVKLRWKVENPDEDELSYRVFVRRVGIPAPASTADAELGQGWLRLGGPEPLVRTELEWNTETVADGLYELKVVVSDERSNPPEQALLTEQLTPPFLVDNRRPEVRDLAWNAGAGTLSGRATDTMAPIAELSYSVDGGDFYPVGPRDGVLDDLSEDFAVRLPRLAPGLHTVLVRAADAADNSATGQLLIQVK